MADHIDSRVRRFKKHFPEWVFAEISGCLQSHASVGTVILCCCAIDYLSRFFSGDPGHSMNKSKYIAFLRQYFDDKYDPEVFYKLVRCGLTHGYSMENQFLVVGSRSRWARDLHLRYDPKHKATLVVPWSLYQDIRQAFSQYLHDLELGGEILERFLAVYTSSGFRRPQLSSDKFRYLTREPSQDIE